jgi:hypothetical protein
VFAARGTDLVSHFPVSVVSRGVLRLVAQSTGLTHARISGPSLLSGAALGADASLLVDHGLAEAALLASRLDDSQEGRKRSEEKSADGSSYL